MPLVAYFPQARTRNHSHRLLILRSMRLAIKHKSYRGECPKIFRSEWILSSSSSQMNNRAPFNAKRFRGLDFPVI